MDRARTNTTMTDAVAARLTRRRFTSYWQQLMAKQGGTRGIATAFFCAFAAVTMALAPGVAHAQAPDDVEEVVVTGTLIRGTPVDSASPVQAIGRDDLEQIGNPSTVELIRNLGVASANIGETNQFQSNGTEGLATVNLRGLGPERTLVLLNGRRQPYVAQGFAAFVDVNQIPGIAIERIEVLKEGAAVTYGSDAVAGVANFLTRSTFEGLEVAGAHENIADSDGNTGASVIWGAAFGANEEHHLVLSAGTNSRSELAIRDRPWALPAFADNPLAGFSTIGNPGIFIDPRVVDVLIGAGTTPFLSLLPGTSINGISSALGDALTNAGVPFATHPGSITDHNCAAVGGVPSPLSAGLPAETCRFRYTPFDNLVEDESHTQFFGEYTYDTDAYRLHVDLQYGLTDVPNWKTSPSYPPQSLFGDIQRLPANHPGLLNAIANDPDRYGDLSNGALFYGRIVGANGPSEVGSRDYTVLRTSGEFSWGEGIEYRVGWVYAEAEGQNRSPDALIDRTYLAFNGFGGPNCAATAVTDGTNISINANGAIAGEGGCLWYNPFSSAIQNSQQPGAQYQNTPNPDYDADLANSDELLNWIVQDLAPTRNTDLFTVDFTVQQITDVQLGGGALVWGAGAEFRRSSFELSPGVFDNLQTNPCPIAGDTFGSATCQNRTGRFSFLAGADVASATQNVIAAYGEVGLPLSESFDLQVALRYESYDGDADTIDPKISLRWSPGNGFLTLRGSYSSTFRGAATSQIANGGRTTILAYVAPTAAFKAIDILSNPNLEPETADALNFGVVLQSDRFDFSADLWSFDFANPIVQESFNAIVAAYGSDDDDVKAAVQSKVYCQGGANDGSCASSGIERIEVDFVNGASVKTTGIDVNFRWHGDFFSAGAEATLVDTYDVDAYSLGGEVIEGAYSAVGFLNANRNVGPLPELKAKGFVSFNFGEVFFLRYDAIYTSDYTDRRTGTPIPTIDTHLTHDVNFNWKFGGDAGLLYVSVINVLDEDPPAAGLDLAYDAYTHSAFGRQVKVGVRFKFF